MERPPAEIDLSVVLVRLADLLATTERSALASQLAVDAIQPSVLSRWFAALTADDVPDSRARLHLLDSAGSARRFDALDDPRIFEGLSLDHIGQLLSADWATAWISRTSTSTPQQAVAKSVGAQLGPAIAAVTGSPVLEPLLPMARLQKMVQADRPDARVIRSITGSADRDALHDRVRDLESEIEVLRDERATADRANQALEHELHEARRASARLDQQLRDERASKVQTRDSDVNQGRIDSLRSLVDLISTLQHSMSALGNPPVLESVVSDATRSLTQFGVEVVGEPGTRTAYEPRLHGQLEIEPGTDVECVHPAYLLAGSVTPLRQGEVRPIGG